MDAREIADIKACAGVAAHLIPDAIFGLRITGEAQTPLVSCTFLEIDRGTMTIAPADEGAPVLYV